MCLEAVAAERSDLDARRATICGRLDEPAALTKVFLEAGASRPTIVHETLADRLSADDFWTVVLGSGYRLAVDAMGPDAAGPASVPP